MLQTLSALYEKARTGRPRRLVLAAAHDPHALKAVLQAKAQALIEPILIGDQDKIAQLGHDQHLELSGITIIHEPEAGKAAELSVKMLSQGDADILMKGILSTSVLLKAVLNKEWGLRGSDLLSHLALFELENYHKILGLTDAAMNIAPDMGAKMAIIKNAIGYLQKSGIPQPKVALLSAVETVNPSLKSSCEAAQLAKMAERGQLGNCIADGPLALDNAISRESAKLKNINSPVAGDADLLLCDDLDMANALYKSLIYFGKAQCAAIILGATAPVVLTSRADSQQTKLNSIALAAAIP